MNNPWVWIKTCLISFYAIQMHPLMYKAFPSIHYFNRSWTILIILSGKQDWAVSRHNFDINIFGIVIIIIIMIILGIAIIHYNNNYFYYITIFIDNNLFLFFLNHLWKKIHKLYFKDFKWNYGKWKILLDLKFDIKQNDLCLVDCQNAFK